MADSIVINAERREQMGKAASRRLRKKEDKVPGILYGGSDDPIPLVLDHKDLLKAMQDESFFSQILNVSVGKTSQQVVVRDLQRNPASEKVTHIDFLRPGGQGNQCCNPIAVLKRGRVQRSEG